MNLVQKSNLKSGLVFGGLTVVALLFVGAQDVWAETINACVADQDIDLLSVE